ncbi:TauD/TfdA dioxygenase family protein [Bradyrhizobium nanningense]|uniref:TauD/TfdA dioxygenase family protein n=1 Tax=Bradyrhizobium nanningense TaxID=1325118 RepID=UPI001FE1DA71|nr:TauD/TfdA family dioxygenase [Bradyrhizobium nanningense]
MHNVINSRCHGGTVWSDTAAAYQALPLSLRMFADQLWAVHNTAYGYAMKAELAAAGEDRLDGVSARLNSQTEHPLVRVQPDTGKRTLAIDDSVQRFVGFQNCTSQKMLRLFQSYILTPENTVRWSWIPGDVAIWDCRAAQYHEATDVGDRPCVKRRASTDRDLPLSIDAGRRAKHVDASTSRTPKARIASGTMRSHSSPW